MQNNGAVFLFLAFLYFFLWRCKHFPVPLFLPKHTARGFDLSQLTHTLSLVDNHRRGTAGIASELNKSLVLPFLISDLNIPKVIPLWFSTTWSRFSSPSLITYLSSMSLWVVCRCCSVQVEKVWGWTEGGGVIRELSSSSLGWLRERLTSVYSLHRS